MTQALITVALVAAAAAYLALRLRRALQSGDPCGVDCACRRDIKARFARRQRP